MAHQPIKLAESQTTYSIFEDNQVLTADQLNSIGDYFDYQDRLTRTCLLGVGIVCGLDVQLGREEIIVSRGAGITTDGDLLHLIFLYHMALNGCEVVKRVVAGAAR